MAKRVIPGAAGSGRGAGAGERREERTCQTAKAECSASLLPVVTLIGELTGRKLTRAALQRLQREVDRQVVVRTERLTAANSRLQQQLDQLQAEQQSLRGMLEASDHERRLVAYELHDGVSQQLLGAKMLLESHQRALGREFQETDDAYRQGMEALVRAAAEVRNLMNRRRSTVLEQEGLVAAIAAASAQLQAVPGAPRIEFRHAVRCQRFPPILEQSLLRIAQEAMSNACRHSRSDKVCVTLTQRDARIMLEVRDWGIGFDRAAVRQDRLGLESLRERSRFLGGKLLLETAPGRGTRIRISLPWQEVAADA